MLAVQLPTSRRAQRSIASTFPCPLQCERSGASRLLTPVSVRFSSLFCFCHTAAPGKHIVCDKPCACRSPLFSALFFLFFHVAFMLYYILVIVGRFWPLTNRCSLAELDKIIDACGAAGVQVNPAHASIAIQLLSLNVHRVHVTVLICCSLC